MPKQQALRHRKLRITIKHQTKYVNLKVTGIAVNDEKSADEIHEDT
jgi:hypothetical protein